MWFSIVCRIKTVKERNSYKDSKMGLTTCSCVPLIWLFVLSASQIFLICKRESSQNNKYQSWTSSLRCSTKESSTKHLKDVNGFFSETESLDHIHFGNSRYQTDFFASGLFTVFNVLECVVRLLEVGMVHIFIQTSLATEPFYQEVSHGTSVGRDTLDLVWPTPPDKENGDHSKGETFSRTPS